MENSKRYLAAFYSIERHLKGLCNEDRHLTFYQMVERVAEKSPEVRRFKDDLKEFADLRNAIVHERSDGHIIAEPNIQAVEQLEMIQEIIKKPPRVYPFFQAKVLSFDIHSPIAVAVEMMAKEAFSQAPVTEKDEFKALLTTDTIARWLGFNAKEDILSLNDTKIGDVLKCTEEKQNFKFISKKQTILETIDLFHQFENSGRRLDAALITENGNKKDKLIGIITLADFPKLLQKVSS